MLKPFKGNVNANIISWTVPIKDDWLQMMHMYGEMYVLEFHAVIWDNYVKFHNKNMNLHVLFYGNITT